MKKFQLMWIVVVLWFCWFLAWCSKNLDNDTVDSQEVVYDPASEYNNKLTNITEACYSQYMDLQSLYNKYKEWSSVDKIQQSIYNTLSVCKNSIDQINSLWPRESDYSLRDASTILLENITNKAILLQQTLKYLENSKNLTQQEIAEHNEIVDELNSNDLDMEQIKEDLTSVQEEFAEKYDLTLIE